MDNRRFLLAIVLSAIVVIAYEQYLRIYYPENPQAPPAAEPTAERPPATPGDREGAPPPLPVPGEEPPPTAAPGSATDQAVASRPEPDVLVENEVFRARFASRGGRLVSLQLKEHRASVARDSPGYQLVTPEVADLPLGVTLRGEESLADTDLVYEPSRSRLVLEGARQGTLSFRTALPGGGIVEKRFTFHGNSYRFDVEIALDQMTKRYSEVSLGWVRKANGETGYRTFHGVEALVGRKIRHFEEEEIAQGVIVPKPGSEEAGTPVRWAGYADTYFLSAIVPESGRTRLWVKRQPSGVVATELLVPTGSSPDGVYPFQVFTGPKDLEVLDAVGHGLSRTVDLGWFGFVAEPMLRALKLFHKATGNYGLDIILLTILVKILFYPLTKKSMESMQAMQKLQPEMKRIQEKYKEDREQLNREVMELYRRHKVNPLGGCLPMLLQLPVFIGLYNALLSAVELRHAPFLLWINDLSAPDRLPPVTGDPLAVIAGWDVRLPVLTLLMGASMLLQQRMAPAMGDPMQQRMMMLMPIVFTVMFVNFPAGLVLYWLVNNVLTIAQQAWMQRGRARS